MDSSKSTRRPCFIDQVDDGLSSLTESEPGFSGNHNHHHHHFFSRPLNNRRGNFRTLSMGASRSPRFYDSRFEEPLPHFLDACFLCRKPLLDNSDIFMYRGDTPFCSEECRQEQIEIDETKEKKWKRASSMKAAAMRKKEQRKSVSPNKSPPPSSPQDYSFRASTIAAA